MESDGGEDVGFDDDDDGRSRRAVVPDTAMTGPRRTARW